MKYLLIILLPLVLIFGFQVLSSKKDNYHQMAAVTSSFIYSFNVPGILNEAPNMAESPSPYWWLNSGGVMNINSGFGSTNLGELPRFSKWRILYKISNPVDTDLGLHPQNIFRLISRNSWQDFKEEAYFKIVKDNLNDSPNRNISNGLLLFSRYQDSNNLYYAGLRVDGTAIIKKKWQGEYFTLFQEKIFPGTYDSKQNPNLLPHDKWLGLRLITKNNLDGSVSLELLLDTENSGIWKSIAKINDLPGEEDHDPILEKSFAGIRTDFLDVEFRDFKAAAIPD